MGERKFKMQNRTLAGIAAVGLPAILVIGILVGKFAASGSHSTNTLREQRSYKLFSGIFLLQTLQFRSSHATSCVHRVEDPEGRRLAHASIEKQHDLTLHDPDSEVILVLACTVFYPSSNLSDVGQ